MKLRNTWALSPGRKSAVVIAAATLFSMGLAGCGGDDTTARTGPNFEQVNSPKGVVTGAVIDTNGNPVVGATVTVAGLPSVVTGASGQYRILNVEVTGAQTQGAGTPGGAANPAIPVTIQGPAGFGGVSLQIAPQAQITSSETVAGVAGGQTNPQQVFIDGFIAGAGTVAIPQFNTTLRGTLRNGNTGQPIGNQVVTADFAGLVIDQNGGAAPSTVGVTITGYSASGQIVAQTTAADGSFTFTGLAGDATYNLFAAGFAGAAANNSGVITAVATNAESNNTVAVGNVVAFPVSTTDLIRPFLTSVSNAVDNLTPTTLATSSNGLAPNGGFTLNFSEPLAGPFTTSTVRVQVRGPGQATAVELAPAAYTVTSTGNSLTVNTTAAVAQGSFVNIIVLKEALVDTAARANIYNQAPGAVTVNGAQNGGAVVVPDQLADQGVPAGVTPANAIGVVFFQLQTFQPGNTVAAQPGVTGPSAGGGTLGQRTANVGTGAAKVAAVDATKTLTDTVGDANGVNAPDAGVPVNSTVNSAGTRVNYGWTGSLEQLNGSGNTIRLALQRLNLAVQGLAIDQDNAAGAVDPLKSSGARSGGTNLSAVGVTGAQANPLFMHNNTAVVRFAVPSGAARIVIGLQRAGQPIDVGFFPIGTGATAPEVVGRYVTDVNGNTTLVAKAVGNGALRYVIDPKGNTEISVVIAGGAHNVAGALTGGLFSGVPLAGDVVVLDSLTAAGTSLNDASSTVAIGDVVPPTTEVQLIMAAVNNATLSSGGQFAGGGAVTLTSGNEIATPVLAVSPQMLDTEDTAAQTALNGTIQGYVSDNLDGATEIGGLSTAGLPAIAKTHSDAELAKAVALNNLALQQLPRNAANTNGNFANNTIFVHNATGSAAGVAARARQIGVTFTEPVTLARPAADVITALNAQLPTARITAIEARTTKDEVGNDVNVLLLTIDDVFKLENDSRTATGLALNFGGQIMDAAGNIALTDAAGVTPRTGVNARVIIRDFLPPVMLRGFFDGTNFVFDFHEGVKATGNVFLNGTATCANGTLNLAAAGVTRGVGLNGVANARVTVPASQLAGVNVNECFAANSAYAEAAYTGANLGTATVLPTSAITPTPAHFAVDYRQVQDVATSGLNGNAATGNSWDVWGGATIGLGVQLPIFVGANIVGPFDIVTSTTPSGNFNPLSCTGNAVNSLSVNCEFRVTHPIRVAQVGALPANDFDGDSAVVAGGVITNQALINYFNLKFAVLGNDNATVRGNVTGVSLFDGNGNILNAGNATLTPVQANSASRITLAFTTAAIQAVANNPAMSDRVWLRPNKTLTSTLVGTTAATNDGGVEFMNGIRQLVGLIRRDDGDQNANPIPANNGVVGGELLPNIATNP